MPLARINFLSPKIAAKHIRSDHTNYPQLEAKNTRSQKHVNGQRKCHGWSGYLGQRKCHLRNQTEIPRRFTPAEVAEPCSRNDKQCLSFSSSYISRNRFSLCVPLCPLWRKAFAFDFPVSCGLSPCIKAHSACPPVDKCRAGVIKCSKYPDTVSLEEGGKPREERYARQHSSHRRHRNNYSRSYVGVPSRGGRRAVGAQPQTGAGAPSQKGAPVFLWECGHIWENPGRGEKRCRRAETFSRIRPPERETP